MKFVFVTLISLLLFLLFLLSDFYSKNPAKDFLNEKFSDDIDLNSSFLTSLSFSSLSLNANPICLSPTKNCQSNNAEIISLAKSLTSGKSKHEGVWSNVEVDGTWYPIDISSSQNTFGVINIWTLKTLKLTTCELSF